MNKVVGILSALTLSLAALTTGCAVDSKDANSSESESESPSIHVNDETNEPRATTGASSSGGGTGGGGGDGTVAEKPKFNVDGCIIEKTGQGWGNNRAKAYCECRAKGYSDMTCSNSIPYIDL